MRQVYKRIPVYTGDVSGVCSALFELGGMVVMHDPSGCNSTYNTHDEIRWYDHDSLIFLSGLNEVDAIMGSDEALIHDIVEAAGIYHPAFIAVANSPIPYITGMDFDAICRIIEQQTGIPSFYISTNGMHDYTRGAGLAFLHLAERFVKSPAADPGQNPGTDPAADPGQNPGAGLLSDAAADPSASAGNVSGIRCNILGMTPLDFAAPTSTDSLRDKVREAGMEVGACWAMGDTLDNIRQSASAQVNLLVSSTGLPAAEYMYRTFGIPYVAGFPAVGTQDLYFRAVRQAAETGGNGFPFRDRRGEGAAGGPASCDPLEKSPSRIFPQSTAPAGGMTGESESIFCLIGEPVGMTSLAASIRLRTGARTCVLAATEGGEIFLGEQDRALTGEEELRDALIRMMRDSSEKSPSRFFSQGAAPAGGISEKKEKNVCVIADPCYEDIVPPGCRLLRLPHLAFSGRMYLKEIPDLLQWCL